jgi:5'-nucleotidase
MPNLNPSRRWLAAAALSVAAAVLAGCATAPSPSREAAAAKAPVQLRLIGFNDLHGNLEAAPGLTLPWPDPANRERSVRLNAGGAAHLAGLISALRAGAPHSLVVHAGDLFGGTPLISALFLHESTIDIANRLGVDIASAGNHEFDAGRNELLRVLRPGCREGASADALFVSCPLAPAERHGGATFAMIAANVLNPDGSTLFPASVVREFGGVKVGVIGAVTKTTPTIVVPSGVAGLRFIDEADAINTEAARLKARGVNTLIAVLHEGGDTGTPGLPLEWNDAGCPNPRGPIFDIARRMTKDVDVIVTGHTHQGYRCVVDGRPITQATALGRGLTAIDLTIDPTTGRVDRSKTQSRNLPVFNDRSDAALRAQIIAAEPEPWATALRNALPVPSVASRVAMYAAAAAPRASRPVGRIGGNFDRSARTDASAGRLIADAQYLATRSADKGGAVFALMNPGGVRSDLRCPAGSTPPCNVTYGDAFTMQPFGNNLTVMTLTGAQILQMLEDQQRPGRANPSFLIPSSTLTYRWVASAPHGQRVRDLTIAGQPVNPAADYRFTVNSFLAEGGDGIVMLQQGRNRLGGELDIDALAVHLRSTPSPDPVPRITLVE